MERLAARAVEIDALNVALINYEYPPVGGGAATATHELARAFVQLGHCPVVVTARFSQRAAENSRSGIKVIELPARRRHRDRCSLPEMATFVAGAAWHIRPLLRRENIDAMIAFFSLPCGPIAWWGWRGTEIPYVVSLRGGDVPGNEPGIRLLHTALAPFRRRVLRSARAVVANSEGLRAAAEQADGGQVIVAENGVDTDFFRPGDTPAPGSPFKLLFVGRLHTQKNVGWLLAQLARLPRTSSPIELHVVGDGPEREHLRAEARRLGLHDAVTWHGWLDRQPLAELYRRCSCLVNPSLYEGMPNVVLEAMASGLPVLLSAHAAHQAVLKDARAGRLFALDDDHQFASALNDLIGDAGARQQMGQVARHTAVEQFSWARTARRYLELF